MSKQPRDRLHRISGFALKTLVRATPIAAAVVAALPQARGGESTGGLEEIVVTAQKRTEDLQRVPVSVNAIGTEKLEQLHIQSFDDYVHFLPSVTAQGGGSGGGSAGPGNNRIIIRGVSSDSNLNHSGPLPTVGTYLDEQPVTTIQGSLNVHVYDIERVEALAGPQGTLYGASSEAGTLKIITNKPDPGGFKAGFEIEGNSISGGGPGGVAQGFVNIPLSNRAAVRIVGWHEKDGGYIDNVRATRTFPSTDPDIVINNDAYAKNDYNDSTTTGARAALKVDLNDRWTITPSVMAQKTSWNGFFGYNPAVGDLKLTHFSPDGGDDKFFDAALTVEGKLSNFDLLYSGAFLKHDDTTHTDYSDYSLAYDLSLPSYTAPIVDNLGNRIDPTQRINGADGYRKISHEIRISSPADRAVRFIAGAFYQRQEHDILQNYQIAGLGQQMWVTGWPETWWLTRQFRTDEDQAVFGELAMDLSQKFTLTLGARVFSYDNSLAGFRGYGIGNPLGIASGLGEAGDCNANIKFRGAPCLSFDKKATGNGNTPKATLTYRIDDDHMVYFTLSKGFRPGGVNRVGTLPPYQADYLKNYEAGWKTSWAGNRVRFNGAIFREDWNNFQFSFLGNNGLTRIANAGAARVSGIESTLEWAATHNLTLSAGVSILDPTLTQNYCGAINADGSPITDCANPKAPAGTQLPGTSRTKANFVARYQFEAGSHKGYLQAAHVYQSAEWADLRLSQRESIGRQPGFGSTDLSAGIAFGRSGIDLYLTNAFDERGEVFRFTQCGGCSYWPEVGSYVVPIRPRTVALKYSYKF